MELFCADGPLNNIPFIWRWVVSLPGGKPRLDSRLGIFLALGVKNTSIVFPFFRSWTLVSEIAFIVNIWCWFCDFLPFGGEVIWWDWHHSPPCIWSWLLTLSPLYIWHGISHSDIQTNHFTIKFNSDQSILQTRGSFSITYWKYLQTVQILMRRLIWAGSSGSALFANPALYRGI